MSMREKKVVEVTTRIPIKPSITQQELAQALLSKEEYTECWEPKGVIIIRGNKIFSGGKKQWQAILSIADPEVINQGQIKFEQNEYFHWSKAIRIIPKKYGLYEIETNGKHVHTITLVSKHPTESAKEVTSLVEVLKVACPQIETLSAKCTISTEYHCQI
jgi:hypothetical protein